MSNKVQHTGGFWMGHLFSWGDPVPEYPTIIFHPDAFYNTAIVGVGQLAGGVGDIYQVKKDMIGLYILVKTDLIPQDYEWTYTVAKPEVVYEIDPADGETKPKLKSYPLMSVGYKRSESSDGVSAAPTSVVKRTKRAASHPDNGPVPGTDSGTDH